MVEVFSQLEGSLSEVYSVIGDFDKQEENLGVFGFDLTTALGGVARGLAEVREVLGLSDGDESSPKKKARFSEVEDRMRKIEAVVEGDVSEGLRFLIPEVKNMQEFIRAQGNPAAVSGEPQSRTDDSHLHQVVADLLYDFGVMKATVSALEAEPAKESKVDFEDEENWDWSAGMQADDLEMKEVAAWDNQNEPRMLSDSCKRAIGDVAALRLLTADEMPPLRVARGGRTVSLMYGFGDASKLGFGSALQLPNGEVIHRHGAWKWTIAEEMSSNFKELCNLVESVEDAAGRNLLTECQLMLFTDNTTAESAFHKGSSTSVHLQDLVLRLRKIEMSFCAELLVVHVSGKRIIESGVDGISRGDMSAGMMAKQPVYSFIPLHLSALERCGRLLDWIKSWSSEMLENLEPSRWPGKHNGGREYLWTPPPAAAEAAIEWLGESIHKRSNSIHVVVVPRLMTSRWRKTLGKICDVEFEVPCGTPVWPTEMYEPLDIGISLPLTRHNFDNSSWRFKGSKWADRFETSVRAMWENNFSAPCKGFWCAPCYSVAPEENIFPIKMAFERDDEGNVILDKRDQGRFLAARPGDHLMHDFQCDLCHFRNMRMRDPMVEDKAEDFKLMRCIRRCNLDALWAKEPTTVDQNRRNICKTIDKGNEIGLHSGHLFKVKVKRPLRDDCYMALATTMIHRSLDKGKNDECVQFNTVRAMRASASNYWKASNGSEETSVMMRGYAKAITSSSPTNSEWFENFMLGYHKRVGDICRPDRAISIDLMLAIMARFEEQWTEAGTDRAKQKEVVFPALFAMCAYVASLRGEEVPLLTFGETRENTALGLNDRRIKHVVLSLCGRFKNEVGNFSHHIPVACVTSSGLNVQLWLERMVLWYGPSRPLFVFNDGEGNRVRAGRYAPEILGIIQDIQLLEREGKVSGLVDPNCNVFEEYGMSRSFRRGSDSRALEAGVDGDTIDLVNRWRKSEHAKGKHVHLKMNAHYADIRLLARRFVKYSEAL